MRASCWLEITRGWSIRAVLTVLFTSYAMTLIDSLDSLAIFGRKRDFAEAVRHISTAVSFDKDIYTIT